jgi:predicted nucleotidyltransferase
MKNRDEILLLLKKNKPDFEKRFKVREIALFGSCARNEQIEASDIDIMVEVDPSIGLEFVVLAEEIEHLLGQTVDLVSQRAIKQRSFDFIERDIIYV